MGDGSGNSGSAEGQVLLVTADDVLRTAVARVVEVRDRPFGTVGVDGLAARWRSAAVVLVGADLAADVVALDPVRRSGVLVVAYGEVPDHTWRDAVGLGAEEVLALPQADRWLLDRLRPDGAAGGRPGRVVGVCGGRGGAGASLVAAGLAVCAVRQAAGPAALLDLDPFGGGVDLLLGPGDAPGLRWGDLREVRGRVPWSSLGDVLPAPAGVRVVTQDRSGPLVAPDPDVVRSVLAAARGGCATVVLDLPRTPDAEDLWHRADALLVVTTADLRGALAARSLVAVARRRVGEVHLAVRRTGRDDLPDDLLGEVVDVPVAHAVPALRSADRSVARGRPAVGDGTAFLALLEGVGGIEAQPSARRRRHPRRAA